MQKINKYNVDFESKYIEFESNKYHYIDEGEGKTIIFVHGTPDWSYSWRKVINGLKSKYRCIAIDNLGFGFSDKPIYTNYSIAEQARRLNSIIKKLSINDFHIIVHDFGGPIGTYSALDKDLQCTGITIINTWLWSLEQDKNFSASKIFHYAIGKFLYLNLGFAVNVMMKNAYFDKALSSKENLKPYREVLNNKENRVATFEYAKELLNSSVFTQNMLSDLANSNIRKQIIWGMDDKFFKSYMLEKFTNTIKFDSIVKLKHCGHFPQEEQAELVITSITEILN